MCLQVVLGGMARVLGCVELVRVRYVRVVSGCFVVAVEMLLGGFVVMACSVLVVLRCLGVMMSCLAGHGSLLSLGVDLRWLISGIQPARIMGDGAQARDYSRANSG